MLRFQQQRLHGIGRWFALLALLVGTAALSIAQLEWSFGVMAAGLLGLAWVSIVLAAIGSLCWGLFARRRTGLFAGAGLLLSLVLHVLVVRAVGTRRKAESIRRGDTIAAALSSFRAEYDRYPDSLPELVPKYLPEIPMTAMAALRQIPFHYRVGDQGFELGFPAPAWLVCYRTESASWACDD